MSISTSSIHIEQLPFLGVLNDLKQVMMNEILPQQASYIIKYPINTFVMAKPMY